MGQRETSVALTVELEALAAGPVADVVAPRPPADTLSRRRSATARGARSH
jgi:hypothetical protein